MATKDILKKLLTTTCVAVLGMSFAVWGAPSAPAKAVTKAVKMDCRTNGAPANINITRPMEAEVVVTTPENVKAGENATITVNYSIPEGCPGYEYIAKVKSMNDIVFRYTLDDPSTFVTARLVGTGKKMATPATLSLVGDNMLVLSGMNVNVDGVHTWWAPPTLEVVLKAPTDGTKLLKTLHMSIEGPSGEFNNPANPMTMKSVTEGKLLGELTIQLNCQATIEPGTYATIPIVEADKKTSEVAQPSAPSDHATASETATPPAHESAATAQESTAESTSTATTDGLQRIDEDIYAEETAESTTSDTGLPGWLVALIVIAVLAVAGGIGYGIYRARKSRW